MTAYLSPSSLTAAAPMLRLAILAGFFLGAMGLLRAPRGDDCAVWDDLALARAAERRRRPPHRPARPGPARGAGSPRRGAGAPAPARGRAAGHDSRACAQPRARALQPARSDRA